MIRCMPRGICSWEFSLDGDGHHAILEFNWGGEQGRITADGIRFEVRKHGVFSGHWTLDRAGREVVTAQKPTPFARTFEIRDHNGAVVLRAESPFSRRFRIERFGDTVATVFPDHPFTRRATIESVIAQKQEFTTVSFCFWLVVLIWRRAAHSSAGGG